VTVITTNPENALYGSAEYYHEMIIQLQEAGVNVLLKEETAI